MTVWRRALALGWPIAIQQTFNTLMRTVDIIVTGFFSPVAVAALGLADLYARLPHRIGLGLGAGAIAIASQDTGRGEDVSRDQAITQAILIGAICGIPFVIAGLTINQYLIKALGAETEVIRLGGIYLEIIFAAAPMRIIGFVGGRALQGTGDTRTPMIVSALANVLNIILTVGLGLGIWIAPTLGIIGVGIATAVSRTFEAFAVLVAIASDRTPPSFALPTDITITKQLIVVSGPRFGEMMSTTIAAFPFNALLLVFGTEANAAYHIGRRIYQQFSAPLWRSFSTVTSIIVGQTLGEGKSMEARVSTRAILLFSFVVLGGAGLTLVAGAASIVPVFTQDPLTIGYAVQFTRVFGIAMFIFGIFYPLAGTLRAAGDTRTPFYARLFGTFVFMLGASYFLAVPLGFGLRGLYVGMLLSYLSWLIIVWFGYRWGDWEETAARMMAERTVETNVESR